MPTKTIQPAPGKAAIRVEADRLAQARFGMSAAKLTKSTVVSGSTGDSAAAQRIAFMSHYAAK